MNEGERRKEEEKEQRFQIQRGPKVLLDAGYPQTEPHIPLLLKGEQGATPALGSPWRCQLTLHIIDQANRVWVWPSQGSKIGMCSVM